MNFYMVVTNNSIINVTEFIALHTCGPFDYSEKPEVLTFTLCQTIKIFYIISYKSCRFKDP